MLTEQIRVIVEDGLCAHCAVHVKRAHHRDFPELHAECGTVGDAVAHLADMLATDRDGARSGWHREAINQAIDDVKAYHESLSRTAPERVTACQCGPRSSAKLEPSIPGRGPTA